MVFNDQDILDNLEYLLEKRSISSGGNIMFFKKDRMIVSPLVKRNKMFHFATKEMTGAIYKKASTYSRPCGVGVGTANLVFSLCMFDFGRISYEVV